MAKKQGTPKQEPEQDEQQEPEPLRADPGEKTPGEPLVTARYVLASGDKMGMAVEVILIGGPRNIDGITRQHLGFPDRPGVVVQTWAPYSESKEPGTWHYA